MAMIQRARQNGALTRIVVSRMRARLRLYWYLYLISTNIYICICICICTCIHICIRGLSRSISHGPISLDKSHLYWYLFSLLVSVSIWGPILNQYIQADFPIHIILYTLLLILTSKPRGHISIVVSITVQEALGF